MKLFFGFERNEHELISQNVAYVMKEIGFAGIVLWAAPSTINPMIGIWDWHSLDECITRCRKADLDVYLKFAQWIPAHTTTTGTITYLPYANGSSPWKLDDKGLAIPGSSKFDPTLPWSKEPAHVNPEWVEDLTYRAMMRYVVDPINRKEVPVIQEFVCGNEPDDGTYWPAVATKTQDEAFSRYIDEWVTPFVSGIKKAQGSFIINGPETAYDDGLRRMLDGATTEYDHISFHAYGATLEESLKVLDTRIAICKDHKIDKFAVSEMGDGEQGWMLDYIKQVSKTEGLDWLNWNTAVRRCVIEQDAYSLRLTDEGYALSKFLKSLP